MAQLSSDPLGCELTLDNPALRPLSPALPLPKAELFPPGPTQAICRPDWECPLGLHVASRKCLTWLWHFSTAEWKRGLVGRVWKPLLGD